MKMFFGIISILVGVVLVGRSVYLLFQPVPYWAVGMAMFSASLNFFLGIIILIIGLALCAGPRREWRKTNGIIMIFVTLITIAIHAAPVAAVSPATPSALTLEEKVGELLEEPMPTLLPTGVTQSEGERFWMLNFLMLFCAVGVFVIYLHSRSWGVSFKEKENDFL